MLFPNPTAEDDPLRQKSMEQRPSSFSSRVHRSLDDLRGIGIFWRGGENCSAIGEAK